MVVSRLSAAGARSAANAPWSARALTRTPKFGAKPPIAEAVDEAGQAGDEDASTAEEVAEAPAEQKKAAERPGRTR